MSWPEKRPGYLPEEVWRCVQEWRADPERLPVMPSKQGDALRVLKRLIGPDMGKTWKGLQSRGVRDPQSWELLLDLFMTSAPGIGFDKALRPALAEARKLLPKIAKHSGELARLVGELESLRQRHELDFPPELTHALNDVRLRPLLQDLNAVAESAEIDPGAPHLGHATTRKSGLIPEWVRATDARFRMYYRSEIRPHDLELKTGEMASVGSAVLGMDVRDWHVKKYRREVPEAPSSNLVYFFRSEPE